MTMRLQLFSLLNTNFNKRMYLRVRHHDQKLPNPMEDWKEKPWEWTK